MSAAIFYSQRVLIPEGKFIWILRHQRIQPGDFAVRGGVDVSRLHGAREIHESPGSELHRITFLLQNNKKAVSTMQIVSSLGTDLVRLIALINANHV